MQGIQAKPRVTMLDIGLYLRTIHLDYKPKDNQEMADLITEHFPVICLVEDIEQYETMCYYNSLIAEDDYELMSRREKYFRQLGILNPFN